MCGFKNYRINNVLNKKNMLSEINVAGAVNRKTID